MNIVFFAIVAAAFVFAGWRQLAGGPYQGDEAPIRQVSEAVVDSAGGAVELAIGLIGS